MLSPWIFSEGNRGVFTLHYKFFINLCEIFELFFLNLKFSKIISFCNKRVKHSYAPMEVGVKKKPTLSDVHYSRAESGRRSFCKAPGLCLWSLVPLHA